MTPAAAESPEAAEYPEQMPVTKDEWNKFHRLLEMVSGSKITLTTVDRIGAVTGRDRAVTLRLGPSIPVTLRPETPLRGRPTPEFGDRMQIGYVRISPEGGLELIAEATGNGHFRKVVKIGDVARVEQQL